MKDEVEAQRAVASPRKLSALISACSAEQADHLTSRLNRH